MSGGNYFTTFSFQNPYVTVMLQKRVNALFFKNNITYCMCKEHQGKSRLLQKHYKMAFTLVCDL